MGVQIFITATFWPSIRTVEKTILHISKTIKPFSFSLCLFAKRIRSINYLTRIKQNEKILPQHFQTLNSPKAKKAFTKNWTVFSTNENMCKMVIGSLTKFENHPTYFLVCEDIFSVHKNVVSWFLSHQVNKNRIWRW